MISAPFSNDLLFHFAPGQSGIANFLDTSCGILPTTRPILLILAGIPLWWKPDRNSALVTLAVLAPSLLLQSPSLTGPEGALRPAGAT
jgi:hypothetical protein